MPLGHQSGVFETFRGKAFQPGHLQDFSIQFPGFRRSQLPDKGHVVPRQPQDMMAGAQHFKQWRGQLGLGDGQTQSDHRLRRTLLQDLPKVGLDARTVARTAEFEVQKHRGAGTCAGRGKTGMGQIGRRENGNPEHGWSQSLNQFCTGSERGAMKLFAARPGPNCRKKNAFQGNQDHISICTNRRIGRASSNPSGW